MPPSSAGAAGARWRCGGPAGAAGLQAQPLRSYACVVAEFSHNLNYLVKSLLLKLRVGLLKLNRYQFLCRIDTHLLHTF